MASEEWVDLVDEQDQVIGRVTRSQMRAQNLLHRTIAVMCIDPAGRIYVHRRTDTKDVFPGGYDMFVGGVVSAGESYDDSALREIGEELGIVGPVPEFMFMHRYEGPHSRSHIAVYRVTWGGPIVHQPSEVAWGAYCTLDEIITNLSTWRFVPDSSEVFARYLSALKTDNISGTSSGASTVGRKISWTKQS
jgi:isopentenyldiphosphate isomerase